MPMATLAMTHQKGTREEWLKARLELLKAEKALTRASDEIAEKRRRLPWVKVDKDYRFKTSSGEKSFGELFHGRSQLLVYHLMFGPDYTAPCASCSMIADGFDGFWEHLAHHDAMLVAVSRAPLEKIEARKNKTGWTFPWVSSFESDFNYDYFVGFTDHQQDAGYRYNFEEKTPLPAQMPADPGSHAAMCGVDWRTFLKEMPGMSAFAMEDGEIFHTYSTYGRGLDILWGAYQWLDRAPLGRNEPAGPWWRRRDEYGAL
jgi:predicted dithiol-disulfide oxidoreductase (DUF899 family)